MILPELNHISPYSYKLSGFGGINRRETAGIDEFSDAVNLSSDEYPLIMPRKKYEVGLFPKTALMWHNNDRDMVLVPYLASEDVITIPSQEKLNEFIRSTASGSTYNVLYTGDSFGMLWYFVTDPGDMITATPNVDYLSPGKTYQLTKNGWLDDRGYMLGNIAPVTGKSHIIYAGHSIDVPTVVAFKNPVCANIGTSTVICDELNGMWVLEYDKDTDNYTYSKVQTKYTVKNESSGNYITGGNYCHVRCRFEDDTLIAGISWAKDEATLENIRTQKTTLNEYAHANKLIAYGERPHVSCEWFRLTGGGNLEPVDFLHYEFCTLEGSMMFLPGDYVELKMSGIWHRTPNLETELAGLNGMYDVIRTRENDSGVKYSLILKSSVRKYGTMDALLMTLGTPQKEGESKTNNLFLDDGMTIERKVPENVRFICSHMNRIWCNNGDNEIMCCARGNPYVWYRYEGNSLDSWATTIGGDGAFTGCINYGYPLFFKDNRMFRMTGTRPSNFGYDEYSMRGIKAGCHDSAVIVNDVLYYQSIDGVYAYAASTPICVSDKVHKNWHNGKACRFCDKYYISVHEKDENKLYCYDTRFRIWHCEDMNGAKVRYLYPGRYLDGYEEYMTVYTDYTEKEKTVTTLISDVGRIMNINSLPTFTEEEKAEKLYAGYVMCAGDDCIYTEEDDVSWSFTTADLLASEREHKYLKAIYVNLKAYDGYPDFSLYVDYGEADHWSQINSVSPSFAGERATWYHYAIPLRRCENLKLKIAGTGKVVIYNIILDFEKGSNDR